MIRLTFSRWGSLEQAQIDWLLSNGVTIPAMIHPQAILLARGVKAHDGRFEETPDGLPCLVFEEAEDEVFWQPRTGEFATSEGRAFALGEETIYDPCTYAFDCNLNIFASPLDWLRAKRDGCVVLDWSHPFDRLRDCPRIAVPENLLLEYRRHMKPPRMPELFVNSRKKEAA
jgi:hypothetical protein